MLLMHVKNKTTEPIIKKESSQAALFFYAFLAFLLDTPLIRLT